MIERDAKVIEAIQAWGDGAPCCSDVLSRELDFDVAPVLERLLDTARIVVAPGCCSHCSSVMYRVIA